MKRILLFTSVFIISVGVARAQGEMDAYKMSSSELTGTARSVAMGGAFGALGGDISGIAVNPAGIGVYKSSEAVTTLNFQNTGIENTDAILGKFKKNKFKVDFNNLAFVSTIALNSDEVPLLNVGFSYNRIKSFDRKYRTIGADMNNSITDFMAYKANRGKYTEAELEDSKSNYPWDYDWLAVQGYNSYLLLKEEGRTDYKSRIPKSYETGTDLYVREKGSISSYDFNIGTTISDMLSIGLTLSVTDVDYKIYSSYIEDYYDRNNEGKWVAGLEQANHIKTDGTGWQVGVGLIFKPIHEIRIGAAYHSPTWYDMTDHYISDIFHDLKNIPGMPASYNNREPVESPEGEYDYKMHTPDRWTFSVAGVIGSTAIISVDYELTNYKNMRLKDTRWGYSDIANSGTNDFIKQDFRMASTIRAGIEFKPTQQFSIRAGYAFMQSPLQKDFKANRREVVTVGTTTHYVLDGHTYHYTYGLGYRFTKNFYTDLAFVYKTQKSDLYNLPTIYNENGELVLEGDKTEMKTKTFQGLLTFGVRF